jgi:hypothetical protein
VTNEGDKMSNFIELARQAGDQIIKRKQKKLDQLLGNIEADSDLRELFQELVNSNKNGQRPSPAREPVHHKFSAGLESTILSLRSQLPKRFQSSEVQTLLEGAGFRFNSKDHRKATKDALHRMKTRGHIKVAEPGEGGKPTFYEFA